jgi:hypothetical protein
LHGQHAIRGRKRMKRKEKKSNFGSNRV